MVVLTRCPPSCVFRGGKKPFKKSLYQLDVHWILSSVIIIFVMIKWLLDYTSRTQPNGHSVCVSREKKPFEKLQLGGHIIKPSVLRAQLGAHLVVYMGEKTFKNK
jgi:hypothetical protein